jgi:NAD(P)-dependent dehydrogenase (short-subunit alcohol dehydrogenase family)
MVAYSEVAAANALINDANAPRVSVFLGGTAGIGKLTIEALVATGASVKIYLVGRKSSEQRMQAFIQSMHAINPKAQIVWTEGEISLLADTKRVCDEIKRQERHVDLLFLTAGYAPFGGRAETPEGIDISQSLEYYSRVLAIQHLLPVLKQAEAPRVVSVLAGGIQRATVNYEDPDLKRPGAYGMVKGQTQLGTMNALGLEKLADENPEVVFIHSWPGWVNTGNLNRTFDAKSGWLARVIEAVLGFIIRNLAMSNERSGQRNLFAATSAAFGGRGVPWKGKPATNTRDEPAAEKGLFQVSWNCNSTPNASVMAKMRGTPREKIWEHTQEVLKPYL